MGANAKKEIAQIVRKAWELSSHPTVSNMKFALRESLQSGGNQVFKEIHAQFVHIAQETMETEIAMSAMKPLKSQLNEHGDAHAQAVDALIDTPNDANNSIKASENHSMDDNDRQTRNPDFLLHNDEVIATENGEEQEVSQNSSQREEGKQMEQEEESSDESYHSSHSDPIYDTFALNKQTPMFVEDPDAHKYSTATGL